jgi:alanine racemase
LPILILYPIPPDGVAAAAEASLAVTVADRTLFDRTLAALAARPVGSGVRGRRLVLHVEVETGLGRGGVMLSEVASILHAARRSVDVELAGIWSHLAAPEDPIRSARQSAVFDGAVDAAVEAMRAAGLAEPVRHLSATGGLLAATVPLHDSVRLGLGLYGLVPDELALLRAAQGVAGGLRPVLSLHANPVRVAELPPGHGVSYGPTFETARPSRIATLPLGYGDGWSRSLSNRAEVLVRGRRVPLVGNVAMDAVMADVTDLPGPPVTLDDEFVLIGAQAGELGAGEITVAELAQARTTNPWEVVSQMAARLPRVYDAAAVAVGLRTLTEEIYRWPPGSSAGMVTSVTSRSTPS